MLCTDSRILCGVTTDALLKKKAYAEYLEPYDIRKKSVIDFCKRVNPQIISTTLSEESSIQHSGPKLIIFELEDPVGPSGTDT